MSLPMNKVIMAHGGGGRLSHDLLAALFLKHLGRGHAIELEDAAIVANVPDGAWAFSADAFVVQPRIFPGGDIGKLAVCGTVNDLSMRGATPHALTAAFILEEGLPLDELEHIVASMAATAVGAGVHIVAGDTKVVQQGHGDGCFIVTSGIGHIPEGRRLGMSRLRAGDVLLVSGSVGDHGLAILTQREGLEFTSPIVSDCAPLNGLVEALAAATGDALHTLRDPTRGGLATALNEWALAAQLGMTIRQEAIPVQDAVRGACELLGLDPLYVANEGKLIAAVAPDAAPRALAALRQHPLGRNAQIIGAVTDAHPGRVLLQTPFGANRVLDMLSGEQLPRIC